MPASARPAVDLPRIIRGSRRRLRTFAALPARRKALLLEAAVWMALAAVALRVLPFRWLRPVLGRPQSPAARATPAVPAPATELARDVRWALQFLHCRLPWKDTCFPRAIAGRIMLRRRGSGSTLTIGTRHGPDGALLFHAWLFQGPVPVSGVREARGFTVLAVFDAG